jgi:hypothetical protein
MSAPSQLPSLDVLTARLAYDPDTGYFKRISHRFGNASKTDVVGRVAESGYLVISVRNKRYKAHRLAWKIHYGVDPEGFIDHVNQDKSDNRICNLRLASKSQNMMNRPSQKNNKLGVKGVHWDSANKKYIAQIKTPDGYVWLGRFKDLDSARNSYIEAAKAHHGDFFHEA